MAQPPPVPGKAPGPTRSAAQALDSLRAEVAYHQYVSAMSYEQGCKDTQDRYVRWHVIHARYLTLLLCIALLLLSASLLAAWVWS